MARSHPPTLITLTKRAFAELELDRGSKILVATSGGPDSMALLDVLASLQAPLGFTIAAHGVDHGLRKDAARELDLAEAHAKKLGVPFTRSAVKVAPGGNIQARARDARHAALEVARKKIRAHFIATAHHANDRAETVLMRILRGAGASGLAVLPLRDDRLIRPFIRAPREAILLHIARHAIPFARDPSNDDPRFVRARARAEILPLLASIDPNVVEHLCAIADDLAAFRDDSSRAYPLSRRTRTALAALAKSAPGSRGEVLLPGGIVASVRRTVKRR